MKHPRKTRRGQSVRPEKKRDPMIVEMIFPDPVEAETPDAPAKSAVPPDQNGSQRPPERIVFRF